MSDTPKILTVAELELMAKESQDAADHCRRTGWGPTQFIDWPGTLALVCRQALAQAAQIDKLQAYKDWTHAYLDAHGVPHHPPGPHGAEGCRIGDRMDWLMARVRKDETT